MIYIRISRTGIAYKFDFCGVNFIISIAEPRYSITNFIFCFYCYNFIC